MTTIDITIFQTEALTERNGWAPARTIVNTIYGVFNGTEYNVNATYQPVRVDLDCEEVPHCSSDALPTFSSWVTNQQYQSKDANLLLMDAGGGGCGYVGGTAATAPARHITEEREYVTAGEGDFHRNVNAVLHELAHNLGMKPDYDDNRPGNQHLGEGWNEHNMFWIFRLPWGGRWHKTPCCTGNGVQNICGTTVPNREYGKAVYHHEYTDCALDRLTVK